MDNTLPIENEIFFFLKYFKRASSFHKRQECTNNGHCGEASKILGSTWMNIINHEADMLGFKTLRYNYFKLYKLTNCT